MLSNEADLDRVDDVRAGCDAILVGAATVRARQPAAAGARPPGCAGSAVARGPAPSADQGDRDRARPSSTRAATSSPPATARSSSTAPAAPSPARATRLGRGGHRRRRRRAGRLRAADRGPARARRTTADGRGRRARCTPSSSPPASPTSCTWSSRPSSSATRGPAGSSATARFPWNPDRRATLAEVRQIGDVVLLRYALSSRFAADLTRGEPHDATTPTGRHDPDPGRPCRCGSPTATPRRARGLHLRRPGRRARARRARRSATGPAPRAPAPTTARWSGCTASA